jgi:hypothetical protein
MARRAGKHVVDRDLGWRRLGRALRDASAVAVDVGSREDGPARRGDGPTNAQIGSWHEYGTSRVPARSFVRSTFDKNWPIYRAAASVLGRKILIGGMTKQRALMILGAKFAADMKAKIRAGIPPALAQSTIDRKGSSKQLIHTGQLIGSISYKVVGAAQARGGRGA